MRFISRFGRYGVLARRGISENYATGMSKVVQTELEAKFHEGLLLPDERELALARWSFNGSYQEIDEVTTVAPDYRIGIFDSIQAQMDHGWSNDERKLVEDALVTNAELFPNDLMLVPETVIPPPWPRYDSFEGSLDKLIAKITDDGYAISDVLAYERTNQNRENVVDALEQMIEDETVVEEVLG